MAFTKATLLVAASAVAVVSGTSCAGASGSCLAEVHSEGTMEGSDASDLYLLQRDLVLRKGERDLQTAGEDTTTATPSQSPGGGAGANSTNSSDCADKQSPPDKVEWTGTCNPQCFYECTNPKCEETCTPKCLESPKCQTRCPHMWENQTLKEVGCKMDCTKPTCKVECPKTGCANAQCAKCHTVCSNPTCKLSCDKSIDCEEVCAEPQCNFECQEPKECPKPECKMKCEPLKGCDKQQFGNVPMKEGWAAVDSFEANATGADAKKSLAQEETGQASQMMSVTVTRAVSVPGSSDLQLVQGIESLPFVS